MSLINLLTNTACGAAEVTVNTAKLAVSPILVAFDEDAPNDAVKGIEEGVKKIGKSE